MNIKEIADKVDAKWRGDFLHFVDTGEASQKFLDNIDNNAALQAAVEKAFRVQAKAVEHIARRLSRAPKPALAKKPEPLISGLKNSFRNLLGKKEPERPIEKRALSKAGERGRS